MCQLCLLKKIAERDKWPNTLEPAVSETISLLPTAHAETETYLALRKISPAGKMESGEDETNAREAPLSTLAMMRMTVDLLMDTREEWWTSPAKRAQREKWTAEGNQTCLTALHKVNNEVRDKIAEIDGLLGRFLRYTLQVKYNNA